MLQQKKSYIVFAFSMTYVYATTKRKVFSMILEKTRILLHKVLRFGHFAARIFFFSGAEQNSATGQRSHSGRRALQQ